jgi:hypothetical protein
MTKKNLRHALIGHLSASPRMRNLGVENTRDVDFRTPAHRRKSRRFSLKGTDERWCAGSGSHELGARCNEEVLCLENRRRRHRRKQLKIKIKKVFRPPPSRRKSLCRGAKNVFLMRDNVSRDVRAGDERFMTSKRSHSRDESRADALASSRPQRCAADSQAT